MYRLIDRATGDELGIISNSDLEAFLSVLVSESEEDADFFVTTEALELLKGQKVSAESLQVLQEALTARGDRDIGWEPVFENSATTITTRIVGPGGQPLPGLRGELRADQDDAEEICWSFSRPDGTLTLGLDAQELEAVKGASLLLTVLAMGESPLVDVEIQPLTKESRDLEDVDLPVMTGRLLSKPEGQPIPGVLVEALLVDEASALDFSTWTVTDAHGAFFFPYPPVETKSAKSRLELELVASSGEPLEYLNIEGPLQKPQLGDHRITAPDPNWQPSEEARVHLTETSDPVYPGVDPHPLR